MKRASITSERRFLVSHLCSHNPLFHLRKAFARFTPFAHTILLFTFQVYSNLKDNLPPCLCTSPVSHFTHVYHILRHSLSSPCLPFDLHQSNTSFVIPSLLLVFPLIFTRVTPFQMNSKEFESPLSPSAVIMSSNEGFSLNTSRPLTAAAAPSASSTSFGSRLLEERKEKVRLLEELRPVIGRITFIYWKCYSPLLEEWKEKMRLLSYSQLLEKLLPVTGNFTLVYWKRYTQLQEELL